MCFQISLLLSCPVFLLFSQDGKCHSFLDLAIENLGLSLRSSVLAKIHSQIGESIMPAEILGLLIEETLSF